VTITPGAKPGDTPSISVSPQTPYVDFVNNATTASAASEPTIDMSKDVAQPGGARLVTITGAIPAGKPILFAYRVGDPSAFAQAAFQIALEQEGIIVNTPAGEPAFDPVSAKAWYTAANLVAKHVSPPLAQDVKVTLKVSDNLHAALMPYLWAVYAHPRPSGDLLTAGFAREAKLLRAAGFDLSGASQQDGPGGQAFWTPNFIVHILAWARTQPWHQTYFDALPILGVDGTLFNIENGSPAAGKVHAKTGTDGSTDYLLGADGEIITAKGLAGYMTTRHGHQVAFAFYINRVVGKPSIHDDKDVAHACGELLGAMANTAYLTL